VNIPFPHAFPIISYTNGEDLNPDLELEKVETTINCLEKVLVNERHAIHLWNQETLGEHNRETRLSIY
jgi:hypothetical protein